MTRWSARFRGAGHEGAAQPSVVVSPSRPLALDGHISAYTPRDTIDSIDTSQGADASKGGFVNSVHCVKGGIAEEKGRSANAAPISLRAKDQPKVAPCGAQDGAVHKYGESHVHDLFTAHKEGSIEGDGSDEVEALARELLAIAERNPATRIPDPAAALIYFRSEARRRLELIGRRARDATGGEDIERAALMAEEHATMASPEAHSAAVAALLLTAGPLAGAPGARACRACGRGIWCSSSWRGSPPDICWQCSRVTP